MGQEKRRVALSSVLCAVFLTTLKIVVGVMTNSLGILAEAAHSGLDFVAAFITFVAVRKSDKPADEGHPYGHGKIENLSALVETLLLLLTCAWIAVEAVKRLLNPSVEVDASGWAFLVMAISIVVDYSRSRALLRTARKYNSQALEADALHFTTDIWSSSIVIFGLACVEIAQAWPALNFLYQADALAALGVAGIAVHVSLQLGKECMAGLTDKAPAGLGK